VRDMHNNHDLLTAPVNPAWIAAIRRMPSTSPVARVRRSAGGRHQRRGHPVPFIAAGASGVG